MCGKELIENPETERFVLLHAIIKKILTFDGFIYSAQIFQVSATVGNGTEQLRSAGLVRLIKIMGV